ncbi:hypothetical protein HYT56_00565 [Candidatus Woesearchaeota archaeon]|nr:hypothetical protein [Candidatus Woesearchaeota archaeon]
MKRILPDTNIYGELVIDKDIARIKDNFEKSKEKLTIYGLKLVRDELRSTHKHSRVEGKNLRVALLSLYDYFVRDHELKSKMEELNKIADNYYKTYRSFGGSKSKNIMMNDFLIVACASKNNLDIVVSNDNITMLTENAVRAYNNINELIGLKTPKFINYKDFKEIIKNDDQ